MPDYPPYSGDDSKCAKCGNEESYTRYCAGRCIGNGARHHEVLGTSDEHFCRSCSRCGFTWDEAIPS